MRAGSTHKLAKIAQPALLCMQKILSSFGPAVLPVALIAKVGERASVLLPARYTTVCMWRIMYLTGRGNARGG